jgi:hypothetical protein
MILTNNMSGITDGENHLEPGRTAEGKQKYHENNTNFIHRPITDLSRVDTSGEDR